MRHAYGSRSTDAADSPRRGIALLMVITVLVTLVLIAVPFAISTQQGRERTMSELARGQAVFESDLLLDAMKHALGRTHPMLEQERWDSGERTVDADPTVDSLEEITLGDEFRKQLVDSWVAILQDEAVQASDPFLRAHMKNLASSGLGPMNDDRGSIWSGVIEDANGKVNPNAASPHLLANLMGAAMLTEELDPGSTDIGVSYVVGGGVPSMLDFPRDGGWLRVGSETVRYEAFDGSVFRNCERGSLPDSPLGDNGPPSAHEKLTPVINYQAYKMAVHRFAGWKGRTGFKVGNQTPFHNLEDLRSIASWGGGPGLSAERLDRLRPFLTVWSRREAASGWLASQVVTNQLPTSADATTPDELNLRDQFNPTGTTAYTNPGTMLRISDGVHTVYQMVNHVGDPNHGQRERVVTLAGRVDAGFEEATLTFEGGETMAAALSPYPININTAPREVVYACLANLHLYGADGEENIVTPQLAWLLSERIVEERSKPLETDPETGQRRNGPFRHTEDYGRFLQRLEEEEETLSKGQRAALYINAVNPHDWSLGFGTAPWCYRTLDVYHIESRVVVNARNRERAASAVKHEVVEIGSDGKTSVTLDSQEDFEQRLSMGSGAKWVATHPRGVNFRNAFTAHIQPALRAPKALLYGAYPSPERSETDERGEVRLEPARIQMPGAVISNHFDSSLFTEGWRTDFSGAYDRKTRGALQGKDAEYPEPFSLSFWWRSYSEADWTAFDVGMERWQNRYAVFVTSGQQGPELVFRVCASPLEKRGAEIAVPLERIGYAPGTWYHIHVSAAGEDVSLMEMLVDGVAVGRRRGLTFLESSLSEDQTEILVEDTTGFPSIGALLIGTEVVEYDTRAGDSFGECMRATRGTLSAAWPVGTAVRELGYSNALLEDVMRGGSRLEDTLGPWTAIRISLDPNDGDVDTTTFTDQPGGDPPADPIITTFYGIASPEDQPGRETFEADIVPLWGDSQETAAEAFSTTGIALLGCRQVGFDADDNGRKLWGWEFVVYERDQGDTTRIRIIKRHLARNTRTEWPAGQTYFLTMWLQTQGVHTEPVEVPAFLVPVSVPGFSSGNVGDDYLDPADAAHEEVLSRYGGDGRGRVLIGMPNPGEGLGPEVITYDTLEREEASPSMLFVVDGNLSVLVSNFFGIADSYNPDNSDDDSIEPEPEDEAASGSDGDEGDEGEGEIQTEEDDVKPPGETTPPEEDPETDSSGGGESETSDQESEYPEDLIEAVREPKDVADHGPPDPDGGSGSHYEPGWDAVWNWVHNNFRGTNGTLDRRHEGTASDLETVEYMPCFRVYEGPTENANLRGRPRVEYGARPVGRNDRLTITDGKAEEPYLMTARVRWGDPTGPWVALHQFPDRRISALEEGAGRFVTEPRGRPRILKFPTGELPRELPVSMEFARSLVSDSSVVTAMLDELNIYRNRVRPFFLLEPDTTDADTVHGVDASDNEIRLIVRYPGGRYSTNDGYDEVCGLLSLDGEIIAWRGLREEQDQDGNDVLILERCERGVLGTEPRFHPDGAYGRFIPHWPVSYLEGQVNRDAASLPMAHTRRWPREGCARLVGGDVVELIHFVRRTERDLMLPEALDADEEIRGRGLLRGRFGTDVIDHDSESIVLWQPFRYWDRYVPRRTEDDRTFAGVHDHPQAGYLEFGKRVRSGYWHRVTWQEGLYESLSVESAEDRRRRSSGETGLLDVVVLGRFNPSVPWDADDIVDLRSSPEYGGGSGAGDERPRDRLYVFDSPESENLLGLESETAEFRVYFVYRPGAFLAQDIVRDQSAFDDLVFENSWKRTPSLMSFTLEYTSRTSTLARSRPE